MTKLEELKTGNSSTMSEAVRQAIDSMHALTKALEDGLPEGISLEAASAAETVSMEALVVAGDAAWMNVAMPTPEANRRLLKALQAAAPYMTATARADERQRTLRDVIARLEVFAPAHIERRVIDSLRSLLD